MYDTWQEQLNRLAEDMGCELVQPGPSTPGMMYVEFGYVEGPTLVDGPGGSYRLALDRYLTCLHELGHYYHGHTQGRPTTSRAYKGRYVEFPRGPQWYFDNGILRSEAEAWEYALDLCLVDQADFLNVTRSFMWNTCMGSYYRGRNDGYRLGNGDRAYVEPTYGEADNFFWAIKARMLGKEQADAA